MFAITDTLRREVARHVKHPNPNPEWVRKRGFPFIFALAEHLAEHGTIVEGELGWQMAQHLPGIHPEAVSEIAGLLIGCNESVHRLYVDGDGVLRPYYKYVRADLRRPVVDRQNCE